MLLSYDVSAADLGTAITIATNRAHADGYTHISVNGTRQTGSMSWMVTVFASNAQGVTRRGPGWVVDAHGRRHWCPSPSLCQG